MGLFPLNIYLRIPGYSTNYPIRYPGKKLPGYGSPNHGCVTGRILRTKQRTAQVIMVALWNRADHYVFALWFLLSFFFFLFFLA